MIKAAGVVIPAHNEEDLLPSCLAAVRQAVRMLTGLPVHIIVVADACADRTADRARRTGRRSWRSARTASARRGKRACRRCSGGPGRWTL